MTTKMDEAIERARNESHWFFDDIQGGEDLDADAMVESVVTIVLERGGRTLVTRTHFGPPVTTTVECFDSHTGEAVEPTVLAVGNTVSVS